MTKMLADVKKCYSFGLHATKICTVKMSPQLPVTGRLCVLQTHLLIKLLSKDSFKRSNYSFYNGDLKMCKMFPEISHPVTSSPLHRFVAELYLLLAASKVL